MMDGEAGREPIEAAERRDSERYETVANRARLGWWVAGEFEEFRAKVVNVSRGGARVAAEAVPTESRGWVRLESPIATPWHEFQVVWTRARFETGLQFPEGCPYELFKAAWGLAITP